MYNDPPVTLSLKGRGNVYSGIKSFIVMRRQHFVSDILVYLNELSRASARGQLAGRYPGLYLDLDSN